MSLPDLIVVALICCIVFGASQASGAPDDFILKTKSASWKLAADAASSQLVDNKTGRTFSSTSPEAFARVRRGAAWEDATSVRLTGSSLAIGFPSASATITVERADDFLVLTVAEVKGDGVDEMQFGRVRLASDDAAKLPLAACVLARNVTTNVVDLPRAQTYLCASSYGKLGHAGASAAFIFCDPSALRTVMQNVVDASPDLPHSAIGGPRALDSAASYGSYLFNFGDLNEQTADQWIALARSLGIDQIDFHGGSSFRFGDCRPNPVTYPEGRASLKRTIDKLHAAGIKAGLHTYAFFLARESEWVSPKPDPRLAFFREFTLSEDLPADAAGIRTTEDTSGVSTITGFFVHNSVTLRIEDELVVFTGVSKKAPFGFTGCQRGAWGTKAAAHPKGAKAYHLKECFGLFAPDGESTLYEEVAKRTADTFNECGFDMIYLDALDGEGLIGGHEWGWHYGSKFVFLIWKHLKRPALQEMSTFHHHLWFVRSRMGAWDHPTRSHKKFIDLHCESNRSNARMFLPGHLGWWAFKPSADSQTERTYDDDIAYLCAKAIGTNCGLSIMGVSPDNLGKPGPLARLSEVVRRYETARRSGSVSEAVRSRLARPGEDYLLVSADGEAPSFAPAAFERRVFDGPGSGSWDLFNRFSAQKPLLRIEALWSPAPEGAPGNLTLLDTSSLASCKHETSSADVTFKPSAADKQTPSGKQAILLETSAASSGAADTPSAAYSPLEHGTRKLKTAPGWARMELGFEPARNLGEAKAIGVWVHGDGSGAALNFQVRSPIHLSTGIADHYVPLDFEGWRWFSLVEPEGERSEQFGWPYSSNLYAMYRELVNYTQVGSVSVWVGNLRPGQRSGCLIGPVEALGVKPEPLVQPEVSINGSIIALGRDIPAGGYAELTSDGTLTVFGPDGQAVEGQTSLPELPALKAGANSISFKVAPSSRARLTVGTLGRPM